MPTTRIIVPSGHLGTMPFFVESFQAGVSEKPDFIVADSGSCDIGPYPLGADVPPSSEKFQRHDLERRFVRGGKNDVRRTPRFQGLLPACGA